MPSGVVLTRSCLREMPGVSFSLLTDVNFDLLLMMAPLSNLLLSIDYKEEHSQTCSLLQVVSNMYRLGAVQKGRCRLSVERMSLMIQIANSPGWQTLQR